MKSALLRLRESRDSLSETERAVADYLLAHPQEAMELSIHEMAERSFSSPSTIVRMCRRIGFDGFKEFRRCVTYEMAVRKQSQEEEQKEISREDSLDEIIEKITYKNIMSLEDTKNLLDGETLAKCVDLISQCRAVLLFGIGASLCAARDAYLKFLRLNKPCIVNDDWHSQYLQAKNASPDDLGIVISYSGETVEMVECMKAMKENGTPIIAITRCVNSPVSQLADYKLYTAANESVFRSGAMSSRISQLNIIDILYTAFANEEYDYMLERLSKTHIRKPGNLRPPSTDEPL
ncbi:MurR/RpiR family transcriptional regulator [Pseudoflavonifractor sp. An85]|uniref:MurR/RpiR family transcriptional regulator n=1 Tax=Pseudoflavonifractor sp. An85 TaxID=1965661 RepID=UPI000B36EFF7|nr:MurR/RpiR family transcriptional regulator [Pseudoflavonifractor sp. An85]OUN20070.1 RpiR family transcriptional regulator [Pseudoflavonifractor sp. An85]